MNGGGRTTGGSRPARPEESATVQAQALLPMIWADPQHMPEQLAFFAVRRFGPRAAAAVDRRKQRRPAAGADELRREAIAHGTRMTIADGAALGGPFMIVMPVSFVAALLSQARMVLELAVLAGHDPHSEDRVVDLLVLQDVYPSTEAAAEALGGVKRRPPGGRGRIPRRTRWSMIVRMAAILGIVGGGGEKRSRLQQVVSTLPIAVLFLVGMVLPLIWVPALAVIYRKNTLRLGAKAVRYYTPGAVGEPLRHGGRLSHVPRGAGFAAVLRVLALAVVPFAAAAAVVVADIRLAGGFWGTGLIVLVAVSLLAAGFWFVRRRSRRR
ncbi:hypothetical protein [Streptomyces griseocarneus]|uniref:hypothetical protein n=1 Tax=Streptomyces griseocarneus TaxID=51201 RepID=UPI00167DD36F|nr:hypothetical protein [Streptomyces griseocarneus]MBZ6475914.1 hypothetical protein [Streptomyces griseocarneus]GHG50047.1 hypothetical protein GCM10018779_09780 [Streptomyces griseocarneus]